MCKKIKCQLGKNCNKIEKEIIDDVLLAAEKLNTNSGEGKEYLGWKDLPSTYDKIEFQKIKDIADEIKKNAEVFLVIGIGGSYLGARSIIESQKGIFYNEISSKSPKIYFVGNNLDGVYIKQILEIIKDKSVYINVISKSGTTLEPATAFRIIRKELSKRYNEEELSKRIIATTDKSKGALKELSDKNKYRTFVVPNDIGGRYSVLTPVGLLPIAVADIDVDELRQGAKDAKDEFLENDLEKNDCYKYASARLSLYKKGYSVEVFTNYNPAFVQFSEWLKQLFGESEGKDNKGLYPSSMTFTQDLHSLGQFIQDGTKGLLFKTELKISDENSGIVIPKFSDDYDKLNSVSGKSIEYLNSIAQTGVYIAHEKGNVPQITISIPKNNAYYIGKLILFFEKACAISAYAINVNPFNQPGVETYKEEMKKLLNA